MNTAKIFQNGQSQAVRLPKEYRFNSKEVFIKKVDNIVLLIPKDKIWTTFRNSLDKFTDDFMTERDQGEYETRENF